ncbi:MAG: hypothetical protein HYS27_11285 [Deltaproteobacteria bacterium]|nr:hypothetical protein [Deltaproteobacteria bacterium]
MRIKLWQSILLALVVSAVSVLFYRLIDARDAEQVVVIARPEPPAVACLPPPVPVAAEALRVEPIEGGWPVGQCSRCDVELANLRRNLGSLAHRTALEVCMKRRCSQPDEWTQAQFEIAVADLREHDNERACAGLRIVATDTNAGSIWREKAQNLWQRRCD